jgi:phosphate-selective porin OprO/OprP
MQQIHRITLAAVALACAAVGSVGAQTPTAPVNLKAAYDSGYLMFRTDDGAFAYWLDGRMQVDFASYYGGKNFLGTGTEVRRARLGWKATLFTDWHAEVDVDFAENAVDMKDMWVGYQGFKNGIIKVGNFREPFSLETITSSKYIMFMERSYIDNLSPDRRLGASYTQWGTKWYASGGVFGQEIGTVDASARDEGYALTGRFVFSPIHADRRVLHIGGALSRRTPDAAVGSDTNTVRFRARPETDISKVRFITTGKIRGVDHTSYYNGEVAGVYGPLTVQGEYSKVAMRKIDESLPSPTFGGYYVAATWLLTGESRGYLMEEGEFDRIRPTRKMGAWEVVARYSTLDLNDLSTGVNIKGGKGTNTTLGVTWYINQNFKWMLNWVSVQHDVNAKPDFGFGTLVAGDNFNILQTRFGVAF